MPAGCLSSLRRLFFCSAAFGTFLIAIPGYAQSPPLRGSMAGNQSPSPAGPRTDSSSSTPTAGAPAATGIPLSAGAPDSRFGGSVDLSEYYVTNSRGTAGARRSDYVTRLTLNLNLSEHSRRVNLDAHYGVSGDYYAQHSVPAQISNRLTALGDVEVIPEYFNLSARAFAQPVVISELGIVTADNRVVPDGFRNTYGYSVNPLLRFRFGDFAVSNTMPSFAQVFFDTPRGTSTVSPIPGLTGPRDTTVRSLTEQIASGAYFSRLNWSLVGTFSESARRGTLFTEKAALADLRYALDYTFSLLATGGYDKLNNSTPLTKNLSGPIALAGFGLNLGPDFALKLEAGTKYNSLSLQGSLRFNITPTSSLVASADDYVKTPAGQLLNNLSNLTSLGDGNIGSSDSLLGNGTFSSLSSFDMQSPGSTSLDNKISRFQIASAFFVKDFERNHVNLGVFATRRTILESPIGGRETSNTYGTRVSVSRDITPLLTGRLGGTYSHNEEFGFEGDTMRAEGQIDYSLSREMRVYLRSSYAERLSSNSLQTLSPLTGNTNDLRVLIGLSRSF